MSAPKMFRRWQPKPAQAWCTDCVWPGRFRPARAEPAARAHAARCDHTVRVSLSVEITMRPLRAADTAGTG